MKIQECCVLFIGFQITKRRKAYIETKKIPAAQNGTTGKHPLVGVDGFEPPTLCL